MDKPRPDRQSATELTNLTLDNYVIVENLGKFTWVLRRIHNVVLRLSTSKEKFKKGSSLGYVIQRIFCLLFKIITLGQWALDTQSSIGFSDEFRIGNGERNLQIGYFQHCQWLNNKKVIDILNGLKIANPSETYLEVSQSLIGERILVLHLRFGDYVFEDKIGVPTKTYFTRAIDYQLKTTNYDKLLVFTNERDRAIEYVDGFSSEVIQIIAEDSGLTPAENLDLMRLGSGYVISDSTFSWWGAFLSHTKNPLVICPNPWFSGYDEPAKLIPPNWVRINME
jgi:hypothetical protein